MKWILTLLGITLYISIPTGTPDDVFTFSLISSLGVVKYLILIFLIYFIYKKFGGKTDMLIPKQWKSGKYWAHWLIIVVVVYGLMKFKPFSVNAWYAIAQATLYIAIADPIAEKIVGLE